MRKVRKYLAVFFVSFLHTSKNYKALAGLSIFLMTCLVIFASLWKIVAAKAGVHTFQAEDLLWYIAFNEWVLISIPDVQDEMEDDLRGGRLAYLLPRPISYLGSVFAESLGKLFVNLIVLGVVTFLFTWWQAGVLPFDGIGMLISLFFGILAGVTAILFQMLIGLSAFWLQEVSPCFWVWEKSLFMFGGLMLPLTVYPKWMQTIASFTPFPTILGERSALALDFSFERVITLFWGFLIWGTLGALLLLFAYRKGLAILNVEGG